MMRALRIVWFKELVENLRDRRTVFAALVMGPLLAPLLFGFMMRYMISEGVQDAARPLSVAVGGPGEAPNLRAWLGGHGIATSDFAGDEAAARAAVVGRELPLVLWVPADFGERLQAGRPAPLQLYLDDSDREHQREAERLRGQLAQYSQQIALQRLALRGVDPALLTPIPLHEVDVSTPAARAALLFGMLSFFLILAMLAGGLYLAIDTTAGERERGTLEPLFTLPVPREALLLGKLAATASFMTLSLVLTTTAFFLVMSRIDLAPLGMSANLGLTSALAVIAVTLPLVPAAAGLLTLVAAFARSVREAQAWLGAIQLLPTMPLVLASIANLAPTPWLMLVPSLSQHFLVTRVLRAEPLAAPELLLSAGSSLALGALLVWASLRVYRREALLV